MQRPCTSCYSLRVRLLSTSASHSTPPPSMTPRRRHPLPERPPNNPNMIRPRPNLPHTTPASGTRHSNSPGMFSQLSDLQVGIARELGDLSSPAEALAHHKENMGDYDLVSAGTALGRVVGGELSGSGGALAPWKRQAVRGEDVDTLARHTVSLLREELAKEAAVGRGVGVREGGGKGLAPRTLATTLHALSRLGRCPASLLNEVSYSLLHKGLCGGVATLSPPDVAQLTFAFSRANVPAHSLFSALEERMVGPSSSSSSSSSSSLAGRASPPPPIDDYREGELAGILLSYASLQTHAPKLFAMASQRVLARKEQRDTVTPAVLSTTVLAHVKAAPLHPSHLATTMHTLESLSHRIDSLARMYKVPLVQPYAFTAQGSAVIAWGYTRALEIQEEGRKGGAASTSSAATATATATATAATPIVPTTSHLSLSAAVRVLAAVGSSFTHPQTLATATAPQVAMMAQAFAGLHERCVREGAGGEGLLTQLGTGKVISALARACVRILDPYSSGPMAGEAAASAAASARGILTPQARTPALTLSAPSVSAPSTPSSTTPGIGQKQPSGGLADDVMAALELLQFDRKGGKGGKGSPQVKVEVEGGEGGVETTAPSPSPPTPRFSPLHFSHSVALATPFSMHDVAQVSDALLRVGYTTTIAGGKGGGGGILCEGGNELAQCWAKLGERVVRGGGKVKDGDTHRESALKLREDGVRQLSAKDAADLAVAFALGAPTQHALSVMEVLASELSDGVGGDEAAAAAAAASLAAEKVGEGSSQRAGAGSGGENEETRVIAALKALVSPPPPPSSTISPPTTRTGEVLTPSFDQEPTWNEGEEEAQRRAVTFKSPPSYPVHRLRGEATPLSRDPREFPRGNVEEGSEESLLLSPLDSPNVSLGTRSSAWSARVLFKSSPLDLLRLASAFSFVFPVVGEAERGVGGSSHLPPPTLSHSTLPTHLAPKSWGALRVGGVHLSKRHTSGFLHKTASKQHKARVASLTGSALRAVCTRLGESVVGKGGEWGYAARLLPLLARRVLPGEGGEGGVKGGIDGGHTSPLPPWPQESLARSTARTLADTFEGGGSSGGGGGGGGGGGKDTGTRRKPLPYPLATYGATAQALGVLVCRSLHRASLPRHTPSRLPLSNALSDCHHARVVLSHLMAMVTAREGSKMDKGREKSVKGLRVGLTAALMPIAHFRHLTAPHRGGSSSGVRVAGGEDPHLELRAFFKQMDAFLASSITSITTL